MFPTKCTTIFDLGVSRHAVTHAHKSQISAVYVLTLPPNSLFKYFGFLYRDAMITAIINSDKKQTCLKRISHLRTKDTTI